MNSSRYSPPCHIRRGSALVAVMMLMVVLTMVGLMVIAIGSLDYRGAQRDLMREQAFYLAEAGRHHALLTLSITHDWTGLPTALHTDVAAGNGSYTVELEPVTASRVYVISTGTARDVRVTVSELIEK